MIISVGIDPSLALTGYAIIRKPKDDEPYLDQCGLITGKKGYTWVENAYLIAQVAARMHGSRYTIECPQTWSSSRGIPAKMSGNLQKLYFLAGAIYLAVGSKAYMVEVNTWKGNAPKKVNYYRMQRKYGFKFKMNDKNLNVADAIGLADYGLSLPRDCFYVKPVAPSLVPYE